MPYEPSSAVRCFVIAATYKDFDSFCHKMKVNSKDKDIICVIPNAQWERILYGCSPTASVFVFLQGWAREVSPGVAHHLIDRVNLVTMKSEEPYKRDGMV